MVSSDWMHPHKYMLRVYLYIKCRVPGPFDLKALYVPEAQVPSNRDTRHEITANHKLVLIYLKFEKPLEGCSINFKAKAIR